MNKDYAQRDKILFGEYNPDKYLGGCRNFTCSKEVMQTLVENDYIDPNECQNYSPMTKEFMEILHDIDNVRFNGYAISPDRDDYRLTIDGVDVEIEDTDYDNISLLVESFHYADEFNFSHDGDSYFLHAWWD